MADWYRVGALACVSFGMPFFYGHRTDVAAVAFLVAVAAMWLARR